MLFLRSQTSRSLTSSESQGALISRYDNAIRSRNFSFKGQRVLISRSPDFKDFEEHYAQEMLTSRSANIRGRYLQNALGSNDAHIKRRWPQRALTSKISRGANIKKCLHQGAPYSRALRGLVSNGANLKEH